MSDYSGAGMADNSDEELMARVRAGQAAGMEALVRRYERELFHYLKRYVGEASLADDVFQNTFLQVYLKREAYDRQKRFRPWLYAIATNQAIDALRRANRRSMISLDRLAEPGADGQFVMPEVAISIGEMPCEGLSREEQRDRVRAAVDGLAEHLRQVVILAYFQGMRYRDIAETLSIPVGTVKSRLFTAIRQLQERWGATATTTQGGGHAR